MNTQHVDNISLVPPTKINVKHSRSADDKERKVPWDMHKAENQVSGWSKCIQEDSSRTNQEE